MKKLIVGNWKMNLNAEQALQLVRDIVTIRSAARLGDVELAVCPAFPYLVSAVDLLSGESVAVGAQDCSDQDNGAYTGQVSARMLSDIGCRYVILGHSERRQYNGESNALVMAKAEKAINHGLVPIICVGETQDERDSGRAQEVVKRQIIESLPARRDSVNFVVAYEPVWAIGTGKTASRDDVAEMHAFIRLLITPRTMILYGGSMKPDNAAALLSTTNVDGGLIGGASLTADQFMAIAQAGFIG